MVPQTELIQPLTVCQQAIITVMQAAISDKVGPDGLRVVPVFDQHSDRYQLLCQGWTASEKRVFYPVVHIEIIQGKVWIQHNQSDIDFGERLAEQGIPKPNIVLGLHPPSLRQLNPVYSVGE